jgi:hypothetical protein
MIVSNCLSAATFPPNNREPEASSCEAAAKLPEGQPPWVGETPPKVAKTR